jgi:hypothetical protein
MKMREKLQEAKADAFSLRRVGVQHDDFWGTF